MNRYGFRAGLAMAGATALALAACDDGNRQIAAPQPAPLAELDAMADLPPAAPAQVAYDPPERGYQWAERAYGLQRAVYDTPPDYGFAYEDVEPYVWETEDEWALYAEPWEDDYRYYYYEPGAAYPYFVRDDDYGYAFGPTGALVAVFYPDGRYAPQDLAYRLAPVAGRYWARGQGLRRTAWQAPRRRIDERVWVEQAPRVTRSADPWLQAARDDRAWRAWRERDDDRELRRFAQETRRRQAEAQAWRERAARLPPPDLAAQDRDRALRAAQADARLDRRQAQAEARAAEQRERQAAVRREARRDAQADRQRARAEAQADRRRDQAEQTRQAQRQAQVDQRRQAQQAEAARRQTQAEQRQVRAEQARQAQVAQRQKAQEAQRVQRQQTQAEQRRAQMEQHRQAQAERQQAVQAQRQQAQAEQRRAAQAERQQAQKAAQAQQARAQQQAQARQARAASAADRGQPAADHARSPGRGRDKDKKD